MTLRARGTLPSLAGSNARVPPAPRPTAVRPRSEPAAPSEPAADEGVRWMVAWCAGEEAAFGRLVERYSPAVWALLTRFLGPVAEREDLVQDVFLRVVRARERYRPTARFSTFLYTIVFNLAANERERSRWRRTLPLGGAEDGDAAREPADPRALAPDAAVERRDTREHVRRAIASLPAQQRMALVLARYEDLAYAEIAEVLGSSEKAVKSLVHRARETLRERLAGLDEREDAP